MADGAGKVDAHLKACHGHYATAFTAAQNARKFRTDAEGSASIAEAAMWDAHHATSVTAALNAAAKASAASEAASAAYDSALECANAAAAAVAAAAATAAVATATTATAAASCAAAAQWYELAWHDVYSKCIVYIDI